MAARVMAAFAHPDDEAFGTAGVLARAVSLGATVTLICATRGEVGEIAEGTDATPETLGTVREQELRDAARALGVEDVRFLGYRDSGMAGTADNEDPRAFSRAPADEVIGRLEAILRETRPDLVLTFEPGGGYGHPDHVAISHYTTAAFERAEPDLPSGACLYYAAIARSVMREMAERAKAAGMDIGALAQVGLDEVGIPDEAITASVDVAPWLERKKQALMAHRSQLGTMGPLTQLPTDWRDRVMSQETFALARGGATVGLADQIIPRGPAA